MGVIKADDLFSLDKHVAAFQTLGKPSTHFPAIRVPFLREWLTGLCCGEFGVVNPPGWLVRRREFDAPLLDGLAMHPRDQGALPLLALPIALQGFAEHGFDQLATLPLLFQVAVHRLLVQPLDQVMSVLAHGPSSFAAKYTRSARSPAAPISRQAPAASAPRERPVHCQAFQTPEEAFEIGATHLAAY